MILRFWAICFTSALPIDNPIDRDFIKGQCPYFMMVPHGGNSKTVTNCLVNNKTLARPT